MSRRDGQDRFCGRSAALPVGRALAVGRQCSGKFEQPTAYPGIADRIKGLDEFDRLTLAQRIGFERLRRWFGETDGVGGAERRIDAVVKEPDGDIQHPAELMQSAGADAVCRALVFLYLLKSEPKFCRELLLTHPQHVAAQPDAG